MRHRRIKSAGRRPPAFSNAQAPDPTGSRCRQRSRHLRGSPTSAIAGQTIRFDPIRRTNLAYQLVLLQKGLRGSFGRRCTASRGREFDFCRGLVRIWTRSTGTRWRWLERGPRRNSGRACRIVWRCEKVFEAVEYCLDAPAFPIAGPVMGDPALATAVARHDWRDPTLRRSVRSQSASSVKRLIRLGASASPAGAFGTSLALPGVSRRMPAGREHR